MEIEIEYPLGYASSAGIVYFVTPAVGLMVFRLKIGLFSAYLSLVVVIVDGQPKQRKPPEKHFPESQTSTAKRRRYMKPSLRVKISLLLFSHQSKFHLHCESFVNSASTYTY